MPISPPDLATIEEYRRLFKDALYWRPFVEAVCQRHGLTPCAHISTCPVPGTCPVFVVDKKYVVKFFGQLFNGHASFAAERDTYHLLAHDPALPVSRLVAEGVLAPDWPYLISEWRAGQSVGELRAELSQQTMAAIAAETGHMARRLHRLPLDATEKLRPNWDAFINRLEKQRPACTELHAQAGHLPAHLVAQIDAFLLPSAELVDRRATPKLLHADLTADHILLTKEQNNWRISALIDFGDAIVGDPLFELIPAYLDLFDGDKELLQIFLQTYGLGGKLDEKQAIKLLNFCLLHPFDVLDGIFEHDPAARELPNLNDLARWLWQKA